MNLNLYQSWIWLKPTLKWHTYAYWLQSPEQPVRYWLVVDRARPRPYIHPLSSRAPHLLSSSSSHPSFVRSLFSGSSLYLSPLLPWLLEDRRCLLPLHKTRASASAISREKLTTTCQRNQTRLKVQRKPIRVWKCWSLINPWSLDPTLVPRPYFV